MEMNGEDLAAIIGLSNFLKAQELQEQLNSLIRSAKEQKVVLWMQSKINKDNYVKLTDEVYLNFIQTVPKN